MLLTQLFPHHIHHQNQKKYKITFSHHNMLWHLKEARGRWRFSPFFCCSSSCVCGNSTSNVIIREPRMLLLSKFGRPSPFFHIRAAGLVILSLTIWTCHAKTQQLNMNVTNYHCLFFFLFLINYREPHWPCYDYTSFSFSIRK